MASRNKRLERNSSRHPQKPIVSICPLCIHYARDLIAKDAWERREFRMGPLLAQIFEEYYKESVLAASLITTLPRWRKYQCGMHLGIERHILAEGSFLTRARTNVNDAGRYLWLHTRFRDN